MRGRRILSPTFQALIKAIDTGRYSARRCATFLRDYGPSDYRSAPQYAREVGNLLPPFARGAGPDGQPLPPRALETDPGAETGYWAPQRRALAAYEEALDRFQLDGFVYPAAQMPPPDEVALLEQGRRSGGPHSETAWANPIGVPAISIPGWVLRERTSIRSRAVGSPLEGWRPRCVVVRI